MSGRRYCLSEGALERAKAALALARKLGLIEAEGLEELERRRIRKNEKIAERIEAGKPVCGLRHYFPAAYLQYELTRFRLDFVAQALPIRKHYDYRVISDEEKRSFYEKNQELFTRYFGDLMTYEDVEQIIEKRIREAEYDDLVEDLLCQLREGQR